MAQFAFTPALSTEQEARARRLHEQSIIIDLLSQHAGGNIFEYYDQPTRDELSARMAAAAADYDRYVEAVHWPYELSLRGQSHLIKDWYSLSGLTCGTYGLEVHDGSDPKSLAWDQMAQRFSALSWLRHVTTASQIRQAKRDGLIAFYAHCQPSREIPRDLGAFDAAYARGLRSFMLTYNRRNSLGSGCTEAIDDGLTAFGRTVLKHCNDLGIIVDVSHCGPRTTQDACRYSKAPVTANHTSAYALHPHARAKDDDALRAIAATGGVVGIVAVPAFLTDRYPAQITRMLDHVEHVASIAGWSHVAIGTDWPLQAPLDVQAALLSPRNRELGFRTEDRLDVTQRLRGFDDCRDLPNITRGLVQRDHSDSQIIGVLGENALRVFAQVWGR